MRRVAAFVVLVGLFSPTSVWCAEPPGPVPRAESRLAGAVGRCSMAMTTGAEEDGRTPQDPTVVRPPSARRNPWRTTGLVLAGAAWLGTGVTAAVVDQNNSGPASIWVPVVGPLLAWSSVRDIHGYRDSQGNLCAPTASGCRYVVVAEEPNWGLMRAGLIVGFAVQSAGVVMAVTARGPRKPTAGDRTIVSVRPSIGGAAVSITRRLDSRRR